MFKLIEEKYMDEIKSNGFLYEHSTGAKVISIKNRDENKVFSAAFKTLPYDDSGVFHVLEHSVLCGSKNYDCKDPFNELAKGSIYSYLNAITFSDTTLFPIASPDEEEFFKMMRVYLDAVFNPLLREETFLQEGWRYERRDKGFSVGGIVYNEMKGAFSDFDRQIGYALKKKLLQGSCYRFDSGGHPNEITRLSYADFLKAYKEYYIPSNCVLYLYGDFNEQMAFNIIEEYLKPSNKNTNNDCAAYAAAFVVPDGYTDFEQMEGLRLLCEILFSAQAPLKTALSSLGDDVITDLDEDMYSPIFKIVLKNPRVDLDEFKKRLEQEFKSTAESDMEEELVQAAINKAEFKYMEEDYGYKPKGLAYNIALLKNIMYGAQVFSGLNKLEVLRIIEQKSRKGFFEKLIKIAFIENERKIYMKVKEEECIESEIALDAEKKLLAFQNTPDDNAKKIPHIKTSSILTKVNNRTVEKLNEQTLFIYTNSDLLYSELMFDTSFVPHYKLSYIGLLVYLIGKLGTKNRTSQELSKSLLYFAGEFFLSFKSYKRTFDFKPAICLKLNAMEKNYQSLLAITEDILNNTLFEEKDRIEALLVSLKLQLQKDFILNAEKYSVSRAKSYISDAEKYEQTAVGMSFYLFLENVLESFDDNWEMFKENLYATKKQIFNRNNLFIAVNKTNINYKTFINSLDNERQNKNEHTCKENSYPEGFATSSAVVSIAKAIKLEKRSEFSYAKLQVIKTMLDTDYLMKEVRIKGGAYGCNFSASRDGELLFSSLHDPNFLKTVEVFDNTAVYLDERKITEEELQLYIIGTFNRIDKLRHEKNIFFESIQDNFFGIDALTLQAKREEILSIKAADIKKAAEIFQTMWEKKTTAVFGNREIIERNKDYIKKIIYI